MRARALAAALVASTLTALATHPAPVDSSSVAPATEPTIVAPARVLVVGDSVMLGARPALEAVLVGHELLVDAVGSRSSPRSVDAALSHGTDWDVVVTLIGHNDGGSASVYEPAYRRLFDAYADVPRVVVLTLREVYDSYTGVNAFLRAEAARRPNVRVLDWNTIAASDPGYTASDGLHLSTSGARRMANEINAQVFRAEVELAPPPPTTVPPPTTTAPPTTTTTTSAAPPTTTATAPAAGGAGDGPTDDDGSALPWVVGGLALASLAAGAVAIRRRRRDRQVSTPLR